LDDNPIVSCGVPGVPGVPGVLFSCCFCSFVFVSDAC